MMLTVTINPLLEFRFKSKIISFGGTNRNASLNYLAGGKGINVSRQLNCLNTKNIALTFLGGMNGKKLKEILEQEKINFTSIRTESETRICSVIIDEESKSVTSLFSTDQNILISEAEEFKIKLEKMIPNYEIVVFAGSSPCKATDNLFASGIEIAKKYDKVAILDTYGNSLVNGLKAIPTAIHNNIAEVESSLGISLNTEEEKISFIKSLFEKGIKRIFLTDGDGDIYVSNYDFIYKIKPPSVNSIDPTGSGDSFVSGLIYGWHNDLSFDESLKIAVSLGAVNATKYSVCDIKKDEIDFLMNQIEIESVGKKIKMIDDRPTIT
ncbi:MAG: 1-phosphofructokinase [Chlorobiaceae bacterium]|nr:1-phosphofructokinase [Chlorobiaceae bacterium]MBA4310326.1 1-phosphofructokinase [Chlorobiaceae bacterium]